MITLIIIVVLLIIICSLFKGSNSGGKKLTPEQKKHYDETMKYLKDSQDREIGKNAAFRDHAKKNGRKTLW